MRLSVTYSLHSRKPFSTIVQFLAARHSFLHKLSRSTVRLTAHQALEIHTSTQLSVVSWFVLGGRFQCSVAPRTLGFRQWYDNIGIIMTNNLLKIRFGNCKFVVSTSSFVSAAKPADSVSWTLTQEALKAVRH